MYIQLCTMTALSVCCSFALLRSVFFDAIHTVRDHNRRDDCQHDFSLVHRPSNQVIGPSPTQINTADGALLAIRAASSAQDPQARQVPSASTGHAFFIVDTFLRKVHGEDGSFLHVPRLRGRCDLNIAPAVGYTEEPGRNNRQVAPSSRQR